MVREELKVKFAHLCAAFENKNAALLQCIQASTGKEVAIICVVKRLPNGLLEFIPVGKLLDEPLGELVFPAIPTNPEWKAELN